MKPKQSFTKLKHTQLILNTHMKSKLKIINSEGVFCACLLQFIVTGSFGVSAGQTKTKCKVRAHVCNN